MARFDWLRDADRPFLFNLVFWAMTAILTAGLAQGFVTGVVSPLQCVLFGADLVLLAALWLALPWSRARGRLWVAPLFLAATILLGMTGSRETHLPLILIAVANLAFLYGMRVATAILSCVVVGSVFVPPLLGSTIADGIVQATVMAVFSAFVLGMAASTLEARRRREEAQGLLERIRELAVAEERARMAAEMHDSIGHHLTVIKMGLENAERFRERRPEAAWAEVRQAKELTVEALADARRWVRALRPLALDGRVGSAALERLAASFDGTGITVSFEVRGEERRLEADTELVLYRVLQEGLTNALRHAKAEHVHGTLTFGDDQVALVVRDDGTGRDDRARGGFGLTSLADRARALGGTLAGGNRPGGGFELRAELPLGVRA
ncbi:sensor histidine kinase [Microbispora siamensis]|uniref:histidine kinase n=1 Tax=Microbispora siamensis TaxID=564413 RepID=A0ABQ4GDL3_9ACTN|nr:sensor histidine kinase [Microbispora siamensis]GIH59455.1 two-component sensor histidine kinase [Microbispora siamensis]